MLALALHREVHAGERLGWLRAAVLGADDGIVSTASLMIGVASAHATRSSILVAGFAGLTAGAMSMAAGEYVSVASQRDAEHADLEREKTELAANPEAELDELTHIYQRRGVSAPLARQVAGELSRADPLPAHLLDELGMHDATRARPLQAAVVSAASFAIGAAAALVAMAVAPQRTRSLVAAAVALVLLAALGAIGARVGRAKPLGAVVRVTAGGGLAMLLTAVIGGLVGTAL